MQGTILTIGIIASILAIALRPKYALVVYLTILIWIPDYLRVSIGTIDISCSRMVGTVLLLRCLLNNQIRTKFKWIRLDKAVIYSMVVYIGIPLITTYRWSQVENRAGFLMDTWFAYMVARFIITDQEKLISVIKCIGIVLIPLAILGLIEAITGWQPFISLSSLNPGIIGEIKTRYRWDFTRAIGPFSHPVLFGSSFVMFLPLIYYLRHEKNIWRILAYILSGIAFIGALSSLSAGPYAMLMIIFFCLVMEIYKKWTNIVIKISIFLCVLVQIFSNRPIYHVFFSYAAGSLGGTGYHRARMIDLAISHLNEWWLTGYGDRVIDWGWGVWSFESYTDVTNEYLVEGLRYGLIGIIVLGFVLYTAFRSLINSSKKTSDPNMKSLYWNLGSILFSIAVLWTSVSFFGQMMPLFYCFLGIIGSSEFFIINQKNSKKQLTVTYKKNISYS